MAIRQRALKAAARDQDREERQQAQRKVRDDAARVQEAQAAVRKVLRVRTRTGDWTVTTTPLWGSDDGYGGGGATVAETQLEGLTVRVYGRGSNASVSVEGQQVNDLASFGRILRSKSEGRI